MNTLKIDTNGRQARTPQDAAALILKQRCTAGRWLVVTVSYGGNVRLWTHRARLAAFKRLGSTIHGKLNQPGDMHCFAITPHAEMRTWQDLRNLIEDGSL